MAADCGVYSIVNTRDKKRYVGSATNLRYRWAQHRGHLRRGDHHSRHLQNAWNKYGENAFRFEVIAYCEPEEMTALEQYYIDAFSVTDRRYGYNVRTQASTNAGLKHTAETKAKISANSKKTMAREDLRAKSSGFWKRLWSQDDFRQRRVEQMRNRDGLRGEKSASAKLTDEQVREIKRRLMAGEKQKDIATKFGIAQTTVSSIKTGARWGHLK